MSTCLDLARAEQDTADAAWCGVLLLAVAVVLLLGLVDWRLKAARARKAWRRWRRR